MRLIHSVIAFNFAADDFCDYFEQIQATNSSIGSSSSSDNAACSASVDSAAIQPMANVDSNTKAYLQKHGSTAVQAASRLAKVIPTMLQEVRSAVKAKRKARSYLLDFNPLTITPCKLEGDLMDFGVMYPNSPALKMDKWSAMLSMTHKAY